MLEKSLGELPDEIKSSFIGIKVTPLERKLLEKVAEFENLSLSTHIRETILREARNKLFLYPQILTGVDVSGVDLE
jgi:hypothetical protein